MNPVRVGQTAETGEDGAPHHETPECPSWTRVDLTGYLDGTRKPAQPSLMRRSDGAFLLYPGLVHSVAGESESGKSMLLLAVVAQTLQTGGRVLFLDYESDPSTVVERLSKLGAEAGAVAHGFHYVQPESDPLNGSAQEEAAFTNLVRSKYELVVFDGVTAALTVSRLATNNNDDVTAWMCRLPRRLARLTGAAVVLIDHVTKSAAGRGRYAIGAQAKMSTIDGAAFTVEPISPLGPGQCGSLALRVAKDRPGQVRARGGTPRQSDRTQPVATAVFDSDASGHIDFRLDPPEATPGSLAPPEATAQALRRRVFEFVSQQPSAPSTNQVKTAMRVRREAVSAALSDLVADGYLEQIRGPRNGVHFEAVAKFPPDEGS